MKTKEEIVANWLPRYTKRNLEDFGEYIPVSYTHLTLPTTERV